MSYARRLELFDLQSLENRHIIIDLVTYHKILSNRTRINPASLFSMNTRFSRRTNSLSLTKPLCYTSAFLHSFHVRAVSHWNCLPDSVMTTQRSACFAKALPCTSSSGCGHHLCLCLSILTPSQACELFQVHVHVT